jgi:hypothetical protein
MSARPFRRAAASAAAALALATAACGGSSVAPGGEQELITRVTLQVTGNGSTQTVYIDDADGNGPGAPSAQVGTLSLVRGVTYTGTVRFENRLANPIKNITEEVEEEANEHQVYYTPSGTGVTFTVTDTDPQGRPLGLAYNALAANGTATGARTLRVVLCHYVDVAKPANSTSCSADTDIDVTFNFTVAAPAIFAER